MMAALSAEQRDALTTEGYVIVDGVLDPARDIAPLLAEYAEVLDRVAQAFHDEGIIREMHRDLPFTERLTRVCRESGRSLSPYFDFSLPQTQVRADTPIHLGPAVFGILTHPSLLDLVESAIGPEIFSNPVQHIRMKLPAGAVTSDASDGLNAKIPWHQDNGVVLPEADEATILTVWLPLNDATVENGCLQVIPRSHRGDLAPHCPGPRGAEIPERLLAEERAVPLPMRAGSALLMHQRTIHSSLDNVSPDQVRISMDLRYQPIGQPTGRPAFPGFVARSAAHPERVLTDPAAWARLWLDARARLAAQETATFNRWKAGVGVCA
jgi:ectoine hydroxylase-related dioxygenase (phytanoyl-CoA dioxygenase family)